MDGQGHVLVAASGTGAASRLRKKSAHAALANLWHTPCLPLIADGFLQLLTSYESTNIKRILTGIPFRDWAWHPDVFHVFCPCRGLSWSRTGLAAGNASFTLVRTRNQEEE